jgi:hypothetical protein
VRPLSNRPWSHSFRRDTPTPLIRFLALASARWWPAQTTVDLKRAGTADAQSDQPGQIEPIGLMSWLPEVRAGGIMMCT